MYLIEVAAIDHVEEEAVTIDHVKKEAESQSAVAAFLHCVPPLASSVIGSGQSDRPDYAPVMKG